VTSRKWVYRSLIPLLISSAVLVGVGTRSVKADASLALDGTGSGTACQVSACIAQQLTTDQADDVILLFVLTSSDTTTLTISDSSGLDFTQHLSYASESFRGGTIWEYYAVASSPLDSDNITVVPDQCCYIIRGMQVLGISGADTSTIYDQDPSVPAAVSCPSDACGYCYADANTNPGTCSASVQTSGAAFVIAATQINDAPSCGGYSYSPAGYQPPPGFNMISAPNGNFEIDYTITNAPNYVEFDCNGTDATAIVVDAIIASG